MMLSNYFKSELIKGIGKRGFINADLYYRNLQKYLIFVSRTYSRNLEQNLFPCL